MAMMIQKIRLAGALTLVFLSPRMAVADGALAIGATSPIVQGGLAYGFTRHLSPRDSAQTLALDTCRKLANVPQTAANCRVVGMFTDQCFAIAFTPQAAPTGFGWAIEADRQVILRYTSPDGRLDDEANPNGSVNAVAGLCNEGRNVVGMMPHPERACEALLGGSDGLVILQSIVEAFASGAEYSRTASAR